MPYIKKEKRPEYDEIVKNVINLYNKFGSSFKTPHAAISGVKTEVEKSLRLLNEQKVIRTSTNEWKGELNYLISKLIHETIKIKGLRYHTLNDIIGMLTGCQYNLGSLCGHAPGGWKDIFISFISYLTHNIIQKYTNIDGHLVTSELRGVLECIKLEVYRTVAGNYEDKKRFENGSVSEMDDIKDRMR